MVYLRGSRMLSSLVVRPRLINHAPEDCCKGRVNQEGYNNMGILAIKVANAFI